MIMVHKLWVTHCGLDLQVVGAEICPSWFPRLREREREREREKGRERGRKKKEGETSEIKPGEDGKRSNQCMGEKSHAC